MEDAKVTPEKQSEYNSRYYLKNKERIREIRKKRYQEDVEYRERIKEQSKIRKSNEIAERKALNGGKTPRRGLAPATEFLITVGNEDRTVLMIASGQLAASLGRKPQTIRLWETKGIIPKAMYRSTKGDRLYTEFQAKQILAIYQKAIQEFGKLAATRIATTNFPSEVKALWKEYPQGVVLE